MDCVDSIDEKTNKFNGKFKVEHRAHKLPHYLANLFVVNLFTCMKITFLSDATNLSLCVCVC